MNTYLKKQYRDKFLGKDNSTNIYKLGQATAKSQETIYRWCRFNNPILVSPLILTAISKILGVSKKELVETVKEEKFLHQ